MATFFMEGDVFVMNKNDELVQRERIVRCIQNHD